MKFTQHPTPQFPNIRLLVAFLLVALLSTYCRGQLTDSVALDSIYTRFESTIQNKTPNAHLNLYAYPQAPVFIIKKNPSGPSTLGTFTAQNFVNGWANDPNPYELNISDKHYHIRGNMAISDARFDEYINGSLSGFGRDMFGYINTHEGWKLLYLHNTVVFKNDTTNYSQPVPLKNSVQLVLMTFESRFNSKSSSIGSLFMNTNCLVFSFKNQLDSNFKYNKNQLSDYLPDFVANTDTQRIIFNNTEIIHVDHYLATAFSDYQIITNGKTTETGTSWFNFMGNIQDGWKITSWIREIKSSEPVSINQQITPNKNLLGTPFPNPARNHVKFDLSKLPHETLTWKVSSVNGLVVAQGKWNSKTRNNELNLPVNNYSSGMYFLQVSGLTFPTQTKSFLVR